MEHAPDHLELTRNLGLSLRDQCKFDEAETLFRGLLGRKPNNAALHAQLGLTLCCAGRMDDAEGPIARALDLDPGQSDALFGKASVLNYKGEQREALSVLQQILVRDPEHLDSVRLLVSIHVSRKEIGEAKRWLQYLSRREPEHADSLMFTGRAYGDLGDAEAMIECFRKAAELDPEHQTAAANLASVLEIRNRCDEAEQWLARAKSLGSSELCTLDLTELRTLRRRHKYEEALGLAEASLARPFDEEDESISAEERNARTMIPFEKGALLERGGRYEEAFDAFVQGNDALREASRVY